jgi:hypothetical protein
MEPWPLKKIGKSGTHIQTHVRTCPITLLPGGVLESRRKRTPVLMVCRMPAKRRRVAVNRRELAVHGRRSAVNPRAHKRVGREEIVVRLEKTMKGHPKKTVLRGLGGRGGG